MEDSMPQHTRNAPDTNDVYNMCAAIGEEFHHVVYFFTRYRADLVETVAKSFPAPYTTDTKPSHVALHTRPLRQTMDVAVVHYTLAFDLWCQHDGGGATAAKRGPAYGWDGRVETPRGRKRS